MISWTNDGNKQNPSSVDIRALLIETLRNVNRINPVDNSLMMWPGGSFWLRVSASSGTEFELTDTITMSVYDEPNGQLLSSVSNTRADVDGPPKNQLWLSVEPSLTISLPSGTYAYSLDYTLEGVAGSCVSYATLTLI